MLFANEMRLDSRLCSVDVKIAEEERMQGIRRNLFSSSQEFDVQQPRHFLTCGPDYDLTRDLTMGKVKIQMYKCDERAAIGQRNVSHSTPQ
jgi:hypothetical protein